MSPERWQQVERLYYAALAQEPDARAAFLASACAGDESLRREVASLLGEGERIGSFMEPRTDAPDVVDALQPPLIGQTIGHYRIISLLGKGGMGEVYLGEDMALRRKVALKLLPAALTADRERLQRFQQEARNASALNHPNIITIYEFGQTGSAHYLVTEYIEGETLREQMRRAALSLDRALETAAQVASALSAAHAAGITHRDIKPENVMVRPDGLVKVLDFGLAKLEERPRAAPESGVNTQAPTAGALSTAPGMLMGTVSYMSPEQARGSKVDHRTDIFSLGVMLYEMLARRRPFVGATASDVIAEILRSQPVPLGQLNPSLPPELEQTLSRMLAKEREARYQSAAELLTALRRLKHESRAGIGQTTGTEVGRGGKRLVWAAACCALALGAAYWLYSRPASNRSSQPQRIVPLTGYPGRELQPAFSPDGHQLTFAWNGEKGEQFDIYVKQLGEATRLQLTSDPADDQSPAWSPDGQHVAFIRYGASEIGVYTVPALGGAERKMATACLLPPGVTAANIFRSQAVKNAQRALAWSPDNKWLAFPGRDAPEEPSSIFLLAVETRVKRKLTAPPPPTVGDWEPTFSPDSRTLAFTRGSAIYAVPVAGGEPRPLTPSGAGLGMAWRPDGRGVVFFSLTGGESTGLWQVSAAGGAPEQLSVFVRGPITPAFDRQGRLGYVHQVREINIWRSEIAAARGRQRQTTKLVSFTRFQGSPQFSPDGNRIAFGVASDKGEFWLCDSDGQHPVQLALNLPGDIPRWSPDSQEIAFQATVAGNIDIYVTSVAGGQPRRLTPETSIDDWPSWSRDGRWIYFGSNRGGSWQIWKAPAAGGQALQVTRNGGREAFESSDGKFVYYVKSFGLLGVWRIPVEGGAEERVLEQGSQGYWGLTDKGIYFADPEARPKPTIHFYSFATRHLQQLATLEKSLVQTGVGSFAVSPDGRWILCTQQDRAESDIMLIENFR